MRGLFAAEAEHVSDRVAPDLAEVHKEMARPNVTLQLLWSEYAIKVRDGGGVPYSYQRFTHLYRTWVKVTGATMRIERKPGEQPGKRGRSDWVRSPRGSGTGWGGSNRAGTWRT